MDCWILVDSDVWLSKLGIRLFQVSGGLVFLIVGVLELCCFGLFGLCIFWCFLLNYIKPDKRQGSNDYVSFAVDVYKDLFMGHVPVEMSSLCYHFLNNNE